MKVCVYAISKNEEKFVERWYESMKEADEIYVLDTGSEDNTVKLLKEKGVNVSEEVISPWRFDVARNKSLELVPKDTDICVCTDLDEVFNSGWRKILEDNYVKGSRVNYTYNWHINDKGVADVTFLLNNIHPRENYFWCHPVHEVLTSDKEENVITLKNIVLDHYPDNTKSRSSYLPLLELSVKEDPDDDRNMHYLGREYMYYGMWEKSIETLIKHLGLATSTWKDERGASMRFIARCYKNLGNINQARIWLEKAINETPYLREGYVEYGLLEYEEGNYSDAIIYMNKALEIKKRYKSYINEEFCYNSTIDDVLSVCYFNIKDYKNSLYHVVKALKLEPNNDRIKENKRIIDEYI